MLGITPKQFRWICLLLVAAGLGLRLVGLADKSVIMDEIWTREISRRLDREAIFHRPPLSFILIGGALRIRDSQAMLLLPAVLFGAATVGLVAWTGRVAFGWPVGLLTALWLLFSPPHIHYSQYARYYSFMIFFSVLSYLYLDLWVRMRRWRYLVPWAVAAALNLLSHFFAAAVVATQAGLVVFVLAYRVLETGTWKRRLQYAALMLAGAGGVALAAWAAYEWTGIEWWVNRFLAERSPTKTLGVDVRWAFWRPHLAELASWPARWLPLALGLFLVGAATAWRRNRLFLFHTIAIMVGPVVAVYILQPRHILQSQYLSFSIPFFVMGIAAGIVTLARVVLGRLPRAAFYRRPVEVLVAAAALAAPLSIFGSYAREPAERELRDVVRYVEKVSRPGDLILFTDQVTHDEFRYFAEAEDRPAKRMQYEVLDPWTVVRDRYYAKRFARPFWLVAGHLSHHVNEEVNWALNNLSHMGFERGYLFYSNNHTESKLGADVLRDVRDSSVQETPPGFEGPLAAYRYSIYLPVTRQYFVLPNQAIPGGLLRFDSVTPTRWISLATPHYLERSKIWLAEGRHDVTFFVPFDALDRMKDLRLLMVPAAGDEYAINATQIDVVGNARSFDFPLTYRGHFGVELRLWTQLSYAVYLERAGRYRVSVTANNDRPTTNLVGLFVGKARAYTYVFDERDNSIETRDTVIPIPRGLQLISLKNEWYSGVDDRRKGPVPDNAKVTFLSALRLEAIEEPDARRR